MFPCQFAIYIFVVIESPSIRKDLPQVRKVKVHQSVSLTVQAQGTGLTYQWTKDGTLLRDEDDGYQGVSTSSLTMRQASLEQSGEYQCVVENEGGCEWSSTCKVTVGEIAYLNYKLVHLNIPACMWCMTVYFTSASIV